MAAVASLVSLGLGSAAQAASPPVAVKAIALEFKRDARVVDPFRGVGEWAEGDQFTAAYGQESVEIRAEGIDASGKARRISPHWTASDRDMLTLTPDQGDDVKLTVRKEGDSKLTIAYGGVSKELLVHASKIGAQMLFAIKPVMPPQPAGPPAAALDASLGTETARVSYAAGMRMAQTLKAQSQPVDPDLVAKAMKDVASGGPTLMNDDQVQAALMGVETQLNYTAFLVRKKQLLDQNKRESEEFLAENKKKDGVVTLPDGLQYKIIKAGTGKRPTTALDAATVQYQGSLTDGTVFDDSRKRKDGGPVTFPLRAVIKGWQEALKMMPAGSHWQIFVPPELAYGEQGVPRAKIPPNAALIFDVELLGVNEPKAPAQSAKAAEPAAAPEVAAALKKIEEAIKQQQKSP